MKDLPPNSQIVALKWFIRMMLRNVSNLRAAEIFLEQLEAAPIEKLPAVAAYLRRTIKEL